MTSWSSSSPRNRVPAAALLALIALGSLAPTPALAEPIWLDQPHPVIAIGPQLELLEDPTRTLTIEEVASPALRHRFRTVTSGHLITLPASDSARWFRFSIRGGGDQRWVLSFPQPFIPTITVHLPRGLGANARWEVHEGGFYTSHTLGYGLIYPLPRANRAEKTIYFRLQGAWPIAMHPFVSTEETCHKVYEGFMLWNGIFYGVMLIMALLNLVLFVALRDRNYLYYVAVVVAISFYTLLDNGLLAGRAAWAPRTLGYLYAVAIGVLVISSGAFSRSFLATRRTTLLADKILLVYMALGALLVVSTLIVGPGSFFQGLGSMLGLSAPVVIVASGALCWKRGRRPAKIYLLAWTIFGLGGAVTALPSMYHWGSYFFQVAAILNAMLLTVAMFDRMRALRLDQERSDQARKEAEEAQQETELRFRAAFDQTFQLMGLAKPDGTLLEVNRAALSLMGLPPDVAPGRIFWEPGSWPQATPGELCRVKQACCDAAGGQFVRFETRVEDREGRRLWLDFSVKPLTNEKGEVSLLILEGHNITDRVEAAEKLAQAHAQLEATFQSLLRRENLLRLVNETGRRLFSASSWTEVIPRCLADLGTAAEVSRAYLFENEQGDHGRLLTSQRFEWVAPGIPPRLERPEFRHVSYEEAGLERWVKELSHGRPVRGVVREFPERERSLLGAEGTRSLVVVPLFQAQGWWGFLGLDDCDEERDWSEADVAVLQSVAGVLGGAIRREQVAEELRESEAKYRTIFENAQVGLFRIRVGDGKVLESNATMATIFGFSSPEEFIASYYLLPNWVDQTDRQRMWDEFEKCGGVVNNFEAQFYRKDRTPFWARFSARVSLEKGYLEGVGQDISDEKKWTQELRESESRYRIIFETSASAMIIFGDDGKITQGNREFEKLTGYTQEDVRRGLGWMELFSGRTLERLKQYHVRRAIDPESVPRSYEATLLDRQGHAHEGIVVVNMIPGTKQRVAGFLDLTERKQAEQQMLRADKMAALGQIIAGVAHEINNPNNFIYFNLPILRRYLETIRPLLDRYVDEDPDLKILNMPYAAFLTDIFKLLDNMQHGSERITGIVSELKNYIRGQDAEERKPESLEQVTQRVMVLVGKQVQKMVKRLEVQVEPGLPPVLIHSGKIEQVLINLIINAAQASDKTDSWVKLTAARDPQDPKRVEIAVEDNGAGIPEENLLKIFDPFFTTKGRESGTGLGLAISQRIVEEHGGSLTVTSEVGKGSRFRLSLPAAPEVARR